MCTAFNHAIIGNISELAYSTSTSIAGVLCTSLIRSTCLARILARMPLTLLCEFRVSLFSVIPHSDSFSFQTCSAPEGFWSLSCSPDPHPFQLIAFLSSMPALEALIPRGTGRRCHNKMSLLINTWDCRPLHTTAIWIPVIHLLWRRRLRTVVPIRESL